MDLIKTLRANIFLTIASMVCMHYLTNKSRQTIIEDQYIH
jgi:hypothetical protein